MFIVSSLPYTITFIFLLLNWKYSRDSDSKVTRKLGSQWFTPVILTSREAEIRKIMVQSIYFSRPFYKITIAKWTRGMD
jgi:hypothetical protein